MNGRCGNRFKGMRPSSLDGMQSEIFARIEGFVNKLHTWLSEHRAHMSEGLPTTRSMDILRLRLALRRVLDNGQKANLLL